MYHIQHVPQRHFCTVRWQRFHCTIYVQGLRDGSHKYQSASAKSITIFCKYLRNGPRSLPYLPAKLLSKGHQLSVFDKIRFTSWRLSTQAAAREEAKSLLFWRSRKWMHKKRHVGDLHLPGEHKCFETTSSRPAESQKKKPSRQGEIGHRMTVNISKSDKASSITRKEQAKQTKNIGVQGYMKKGETKLSD